MDSWFVQNILEGAPANFLNMFLTDTWFPCKTCDTEPP